MKGINLAKGSIGPAGAGDLLPGDLQLAQGAAVIGLEKSVNARQSDAPAAMSGDDGVGTLAVVARIFR